MTVIVLVVIGAIFAAGCTSNVQTSTQARNVTIGALLPLTGDAASVGTNVNATIDAAATDVNNYFAATNASVRVQVEVKDTGTTPEGALAAIQALRADGVTAVVGPYSSAELKAIAPYADQNGMVLVSYGSSVSSLGVERTNVFRLVPDDSHQGPALATLMQERGVKVLIAFVRNDVYGNGLVNVTKAAFEGQGGVVTETATFLPDTTNFSSALDSVRPRLSQVVATYPAGSVGVLFIGFENNTLPALIAAGSDPQWSTIPWYGVAATPINTILANETAAQAAVRLNYTAVQQMEGQGASYDNLTQNAGVQRTVQTPYGSFAYDATWIIARALAQTNTQTATALRDAIPRIASSYDGITGNTTLNAAGDRAYANYDFWTIQSENGSYVKVKTAQFRTDPVTGATVMQTSGASTAASP
ncbi:MAG TPA: penicillin-binding protein activator [Candidatus Bathyarchaeia archaeon]|nr:penicillin-binding protein activator [Candidatus Bathyarchaeia archaeon]